jgi:histone acetyltransferase (RNA polymerase elongator complex component)
MSDDDRRPLRRTTSQVLAVTWAGATVALNRARDEFVRDALAAVNELLRAYQAHVEPAEAAGHLVQMIAEKLGGIARRVAANATMVHHEECKRAACWHCGKAPAEKPA